MAVYYVKATGSNTWPFDTEVKAALTFNDLFVGLDAHSVTLSPTDVVEVRGVITESVTSSFVYGMGACTMHGTDFHTDEIYLGVDNWFENIGELRDLHIWTNDDTSGGLIIIDCKDMKYCKIGFVGTPSQVCDLFIHGNYGNDCIITNNIFYCDGVGYGDVLIDTDAAGDVDHIIIENNTFIRTTDINFAIRGNKAVNKVYIRNNIVTENEVTTYGGITIDNTLLFGHIIADFQHSYNIVLKYNGYDAYTYTDHSVPFSPDITEIQGDPLFIGSGAEPYALQDGSPARHTGHHFTDSPVDDVLKTTRLNPPSIGAYEDLVVIVADFSASVTSGDANLTVNFTDLTTGGATIWDWDFGDGSLHSGDQNPIHIYDTAGIYTVTLIASDGLHTSTAVKTDYITVNIITDFSSSTTSGNAPLTVNFIDSTLGNPTSWDWDFGDASPHSGLQNPSHIYNVPGIYTVTLTASRGISSSINVKPNYIIVTVPIVVDFSGSPTIGNINLAVSFLDLTTGGPTSWNWNFGDATPHSSLQHPIHVYNTAGVYTVTLTATKGSYSATEIKTNYIVATTPVERFFYLDVIKPIVTSVVPADLDFTLYTYLTINLYDPLSSTDSTCSGIDVNSVKIFVDDIEYSTVKNSSFFNYTGVGPINPGGGYYSLQVQIGPVANIPNFDDIDSVVIYAKDVAGNLANIKTINLTPIDSSAPYLKGCWPRDKAVDVSRETNVMFFIDDDVSGVDIRTVKVKISNTTYQLVVKDALRIDYSGSSTQVFLTLDEYLLRIIVDGVVIATMNLTRDEFSTIKKVNNYINTLPYFSSTILNDNYAYLPSIDLINLYNIAIVNSLVLSLASFDDNKNFFYIPRSRGYLIAITPNEIFEDKATVNVAIDAKDFYSGLNGPHVMPTQTYSFVCRDIVTPSRTTRDLWYKYQIEIISNILNNLESTYNKDTESTVFDGYFRMIASEIARAKERAESYNNDMYYNASTSESTELLYQNLGYLLKTPPSPAFPINSDYRQALLTLMQMFFKGSTIESITDGLTMFLGLEHTVSSLSVNITEYFLYDIARQFTFAVDIDANNKKFTDWQSFNTSATNVLKLIKPAHTFFLLRYLFFETIRTKNIIDQITKIDFKFLGSDDVRTNCADKYKQAQIITEDVSFQFNGTNHCCTTFYKPILSWSENTITNNPNDIQVTVSIQFTPTAVNLLNSQITIDQDWFNNDTVTFETSALLPAPLVPMVIYFVIRIDSTHIQLSATSGGFPITLTTIGAGTQTMTSQSGNMLSVSSVDGLSGTVCFDSNPSVVEIVKIIYKFNKYVIYRQLNFLLNTYTVQGDHFDLTQPYLMNQITNASTIISYNIPEDLHAHICESFVDVEWQFEPFIERKFPLTEETGYSNYIESRNETILTSGIQDNFYGTTLTITTHIEIPEEVVFSDLVTEIDELIQTIVDESAVMIESNKPNLVKIMFTTNRANSVTNTVNNLLYYQIERVV